MRQIPEAFVILSPVTWQFRRAQSVGKDVSKAIRHFCEQNKEVVLCFLLDARQNAEAGTKLVIAVSLENETACLRHIASELQNVLSEFPDVASRTAIMSGGSFKEHFAGKEFYVKQQQIA
jgi:hypothetical protein